MSKAVNTSTTGLPASGSATCTNRLRRALLTGSAAAVAAMATGVAVSARAVPANPDAELIRACQQFAEVELASWYRYVVAPDDLADAQDVPPDWDTLHWIEATLAATPEGWCAKALALSAWHREAFDDPEDGRDGHTTLLASLVRDMVRSARDAIIERLVQQHGPLPDGYSVNGMWLGRAVA